MNIRSVTRYGLMVLAVVVLAGPRLDAAAPPLDLKRESARIVSQHKAIYTKQPIGPNRQSVDSVLLGNGDVAVAISTTPAQLRGQLGHRKPEQVRFWFQKNDFWQLGGPTKSKLLAYIDFTFEFHGKDLPRREYRVETDLYTATSTGRISHGEDLVLEFSASMRRGSARG